MSVDPETDEVTPAEGELGVEARVLRDIANARVAPMRRMPQHVDPSGGGLDQAEDGAQERCLSGPVRSEDRDEGTGRDVERQVAPDAARAIAQRYPIEADSGLAHRDAQASYFARAFSRSSSCASCHSWKVLNAGGIVSATGTTGTLLLTASSRICSVSGDVTCEL